MVHQHGKLVAAEAGHHVLRPETGLEPGGNLLQNPVAVQMAPRVVDRLESVQVDEQHAEMIVAAAPGLAQGHDQASFKLPAVRQPGQAVAVSRGWRVAGGGWRVVEIRHPQPLTRNRAGSLARGAGHQHQVFSRRRSHNADPALHRHRRPIAGVERDSHWLGFHDCGRARLLPSHGCGGDVHRFGRLGRSLALPESRKLGRLRRDLRQLDAPQFLRRVPSNRQAAGLAAATRSVARWTNNTASGDASHAARNSVNSSAGPSPLGAATRWASSSLPEGPPAEGSFPFSTMRSQPSILTSKDTREDLRRQRPGDCPDFRKAKMGLSPFRRKSNSPLPPAGEGQGVRASPEKSAK